MLPQRACTLVLLDDEGRKASKKTFFPWNWKFLLSWPSPELPMCPSTFRTKCTSVNSWGAFSLCVSAWSTSAAHGSWNMVILCPQNWGGVYSLVCCPAEWWCCGWGGSSFFSLSSRSHSSLNPSAACHSIGSPVICFITIPGQYQFNSRFSELKRHTEKSMCWSKERSRSSWRVENEERNLYFHNSKLLNWLIIPCILHNQTS